MLPEWFVQLLKCPHCAAELREGKEELICTGCGSKFPIINGVLRFVESSGHCQSFGQQWARFRLTQHDSSSGFTQSSERFEQETGWKRAELAGNTILDAGCGSGRFMEIALEAGCRVVGVDLSSSVEICYGNMLQLKGVASNFAVIQASLLNLPFKTGVFDKAYCIGVIQHTPNRQQCVKNIVRHVRTGGHVAFWVYERCWRNLIGYKYYFRIITRHLPERVNWFIAKILVTLFFFPAWHISKFGMFGEMLVKAFFPMAFRRPPGANYRQAKEWSFLDTFDNISPQYDCPVRERELREWLEKAGVASIKRLPTPGLALAGVKKSDPSTPGD